MTINLGVDVGDRVRFKTEGLPDQQVHLGYEIRQAHVANPDGTTQVTDVYDFDKHITASFQDHFGGLSGIVDANSIPEQTVRVRGYTRQGQEYTVWISPQHLEVVKKAMDFS